MIRRYLLLTAITLFFSAGCFAKSITLYDQPTANSKAVGSVDLDKGVIPIFTPKDNKEWVKIADPQNGQVGWVKNKDIYGDSNQSSFTYTQKIVTSGQGPHAYVVQYGTPQLLSPEQSKAIFKKIQEREQALQNDIYHLMDNMHQNMMGYPMIMPVIVVPQTDTKPATKTNH